MTASPTLTPPEAALLAHLAAYGEKTGRDLARQCEGRIRRGLVYVSLSLLEDRGLVSSVADVRLRSGIDLRRFAITAEGRSELRRHERASRPRLRADRYDFALGAAFFCLAAAFGMLVARCGGVW